MDAAACSCVPLDPWEAYDRSDAALVGVFEGKQGPTTYRFRVEEDYKADLPPQLDVHSAEHGASCGLEVRVGARVGLFLSRRGDRWSSSLCSQARPEQVRAAAAGLPRPKGRGAVRFIVGGSFGPARVVALDARGRALAYGRGEGDAFAVDICPGGRRSVEATRTHLAVRDLASFRILREVRIRPVVGEYPLDVHCAGRDVFVGLSNQERTRLLRVRGGSVRRMRLAGQPTIAFGGGQAFLSTRSSIFSVDLRSGRPRTVARFTADQLAVSRDGSRLAAMSDGTLLIAHLGRRVRTFHAHLGRDDTPTLVWDRGRLAVLGWERSEVYDDRLRFVGTLPPWGAREAVGLGGRIASIGYGELRVTRMPRGPTGLVRNLLTPRTYAIAAVDRGPNIRLAVTLPCARG